MQILSAGRKLAELLGVQIRSQTFAQAFDSVATELRRGVPAAQVTAQPWFDNVFGSGRVDALAAGALKELLGRMTERGVTIFLTSHVLEIVERLCSHVAIIRRGRLVAQGSIEQLRAGVPGVEGRTLTLEDIFLSVAGEGTERPQVEELTWLT